MRSGLAVKPGLSHCLSVLSVLILAGCAGLPDNGSRVESRALIATGDTRLGRAAAAYLDGRSRGSGFVLLESGLDAFVARAGLADLAERSIDAQYYLFHGDLTGRLLAHRLLMAADRGVRVRLLVDDMAISGSDVGAAAMDSHPNMEVRIFNPFSRKSARTIQYLTRLGSVTRRMHNKSFTVDNQISVLGGRNIGDEYFEADPRLSFSDLDVMGFGPLAQDVSKAFDLYWNSPMAYPALTLAKAAPGEAEIADMRRRLDDFLARNAESPYVKALRESQLATSIRQGKLDVREGDATVLYDQPEKLAASREHSEYRLLTELEPYFGNVQKELLIVSPYFVPGKAGTAYLRGLAQRGVRVVILTNSLSSTDVAPVHAGYAKYRGDLLRAGVELYELNKHMYDDAPRKKIFAGSSGASLHAKSFIIDREKVFIGSMNLDPRSAVENTEIGVILDAPETADEMARRFLEGLPKAAFRLELKTDGVFSESIIWHGYEHGAPTTFTVEPYSSGLTRFIVDLAWLLPVESQL